MTTGCRTEVLAGDGGPVVRKEAESTEGRAALEREIDRLDRARHPGVVELVAHGEDHLVLAWAGGETLETWRPSLSQAAAVLAACAATIADLHELGLVHGRLQARHVVVGADGRPRLTGFGGPATGRGEANPADDVAALGLLVRRLVGPGVELEPIPDRRWSRRRWSGYGRRSLQTLADHATDDDPARRPTARALAAAIAEAVPGCALPSPAPVDPGPDTVPGAVDVPVLSDRPLPSDHPMTEPTTHDEPEDGVGRMLESVDHDLPDAGLAGAHGAPANSEAAGFAVSAGDEPPDPGAEPPRSTRAAVDPVPVEEDDSWEEDGPARDEAARDEPSGAGAEGPAADRAGASTILGLRVEPALHAGDADTTDRHRSPRRSIHRPTGRGRPFPAFETQRQKAAVVAGAAALALVTIALTVIPGLRTGTDPAVTGPHDAVAQQRPSDVSVPTPVDVPGTVPAAEPVDCPDVGGPALDLDGDGCPQPVDVDGTTIVAAGTTYRVGEPGDLAGVGDWDCDGRATPVLLRPTTGEIFVFDGWAEGDDPVSASAAYTVPGAESIADPVAPTCGPPVVAVLGGVHHRVGAQDVAR